MKKNILLIIGAILIANAFSFAYTAAVEQNATVDVLPGGLKVYSPEETLYFHRMVPINATMSTKANFFKYSDNGAPFRTLCRRCNEYGFSRRKRKPFDDGYHEVVIKVLFEGGSVFDSVNFTVDTKSPKITKTEPRRGFANGSFFVEFQEANPKELILNYGNNITGMDFKDIDLHSCVPNRRDRKLCVVDVNLSEYDNEEIEYWFELKDISDNYTESRLRKLDVDFSAPKINYFNYTQSRRRVTFSFNITEPNFKRINYIDWAMLNPRERLLCTRLREGICEKTKVFSAGTHDLTIEILDKAGNRETINEIVFEI